MDGNYVGCKDGWYTFEDEFGHRFEFDDVKVNILSKYKLHDQSEEGKPFSIMYSINTDDEDGVEELIIVGLKRKG